MEDETILYHYTEAAGLLGLVKGTLWLLHVNPMKDEREFKDGLRVIADEGEKVKDRHAPKPSGELTQLDWASAAISLSIVERSLDSLHDGGFQRNSRRAVYVASFSRQRDDENQWKAYCPAGGGFAVGFSGPVLASLGMHEPMRFVECVYEEELTRKRVRDLLEGCLQEATGAFANLLAFREWSNDQLNRLVDPLLEEAAKFKHPAFRDESECRLVAIASTAVSGTFGSYAKPRIELPLPKGAIQEIWIGPTPDPEQVRSGLEQYLHSKGLLASGSREVKIHMSQVPYRSS